MLLFQDRLIAKVFLLENSSYE